MTGRQTEAKKAKAKVAPQNAKAQFAADLAENYEELLAVIKTGMQAEKTVRINEPCVKCGCRHFRYAKVQDTVAALKAAEFFANRAWGRPGEDQSKREPSFVVNRHVVEPVE